MTSERWQQIEKLFQSALDCEPAERAAFLDQACGEDSELRREVESLLLSDESVANRNTYQFNELIEAGFKENADDYSIIGQTLSHYRIDSLLGSGGMGKVFLARDIILKRQVAIKMLPSLFTKDAERLLRFEREAQAASSLNHPNIITIHEIGNIEDRHFIVTELIDGHTLRRSMESGRMSILEALKIAVQIASALAAAHDAGIIHRDIKPENVMVRSDGLVKVLDFGLAKLKPEQSPGSISSDTESLTGPRIVMGTAGYMSPEQVRGQEVDHRSDIFSFGVLLYEMLSGQKPFRGVSMAETMAAIAKDEPPELSGINSRVPAQLDRIVKRCLEKRPDRRFHSAHDLGFALESVSSGAEPVRVSSGIWRLPGKMRPAWIITIITLLSLLATLPFAIAYFRRPTPAEAPAFMASINLPVKTSLVSLALSPDGHRLAINVRDSSGQTMLYVRQLEKEEFRKLDGTEGAFYPFWSPDSRSIGFFSKVKLRRIEATGGSPQIICNAHDGRGGSWNRDGVIVFASTGDGGLSRVAAAGGTPSSLTTLDSSRVEQSHRYPQFLPDGRSYIYMTHSGIPENQAIYLGSLDGNFSKKLFRADSNAVYASPGYLIFDRQGATMVQVFDLQKLVPKGAPFPVTELLEPISKDIKLTYLALSSENGMLAYHKADRNKVQLGWFDRRGSQIGKLMDGNYYSPLISPDGKWVAFEGSDPQSLNDDIWLLELARNSAKRFTFDQGNEWHPVWSPDSRHIAFAKRRKVYLDLFLKAANGAGNDELLFESENHKVPNDWSMDGRFITFFHRDPVTNDDIWVLPMDGDRKPYPLLNSGFNEDHARFSPNGKWIAYTSDESGKPEIYVRSFPLTEHVWTISTNGGDQVRWNRDGRELFYLAADGNLMSVPIRIDGSFEAGVPRPLFEIRASGVTGRYQLLYTVTPDGRRFVVRSAAEPASPANITILTNWTAVIKK